MLIDNFTHNHRSSADLLRINYWNSTKNVIQFYGNSMVLFGDLILINEDHNVIIFKFGPCSLMQGPLLRRCTITQEVIVLKPKHIKCLICVMSFLFMQTLSIQVISLIFSVCIVYVNTLLVCILSLHQFLYFVYFVEM